MAHAQSTTIALRRYQADDVGRLVELLNNQSVTDMTSSIPFPYTREDAVEYLANAQQEHGRKISRGIVVEGEGLVGGIGLALRADDNEEVGYWIGEPFWGRGIATVALAEFLKVLDGLQIGGDLAAQTATDNIASQRVLEKNGFAYQGEGKCTTPARSCATMPSKRYILER